MNNPNPLALPLRIIAATLIIWLIVYVSFTLHYSHDTPFNIAQPNQNTLVCPPGSHSYPSAPNRCFEGSGQDEYEVPQVEDNTL